MLADKTLTQPIIEMRLVDEADKLEKLLLSDEEIAALEKLQIPGIPDAVTSQRWFANCGGCGGCGGCRPCGGCIPCFGCRPCGGCGGCRPCGGCGGCGGCRPCGGCGGCGGCKFSSTGTEADVIEDANDFGFGY